MKIRLTLLAFFGFAYFYSLSSLPIPFVVRNYLAIVPFQVLIAAYFVYQIIQRQRSKKSSSCDESIG